MTDHQIRSARPPAGTLADDVLQVRVRSRGTRTAAGPGGSPSGDALALAWSCVETFARGAVLLGAAGAAAPDADRLVEEGLTVAEGLADDGVGPGEDLVVLVARGRPAAFAAAARSPRLRVVVVDDAPARVEDLRPWTGSLDGHAVLVTDPGQLAGAVCEALVHDGPALVHVGPAATGVSAPG